MCIRDSLCANPDDGITYKILLNDLRISRYAESGAIRVGENVQITYEGEIDESCPAFMCACSRNSASTSLVLPQISVSSISFIASIAFHPFLNTDLL